MPFGAAWAMVIRSLCGNRFAAFTICRRAAYSVCRDKLTSQSSAAHSRGVLAGFRGTQYLDGVTLYT